MNPATELILAGIGIAAIGIVLVVAALVIAETIAEAMCDREELIRRIREEERNNHYLD